MNLMWLSGPILLAPLSLKEVTSLPTRHHQHPYIVLLSIKGFLHLVSWVTEYTWCVRSNEQNQNCWWTIVLNAKNVVSPTKPADLASLTDYTRPGAIIITETKNDATISYNPFPEGYNSFRMVRKLGAGGSAFCVRDNYFAVEVQLSNKRDDCEFVWVQVSLLRGRKLLINSFYRQPSGDAKEQVKFYNNELSEISKIASSRDHIILSGVYNFKDIDWTNCSTQPGSVNRLACDDFLESLPEHSLVQLNSEATREKSILDLYFTNRPSLARHIAVPGISDHDCAILTDTYLSPVINNTPVWRVCVWSQANREKMRSKVHAFATDFFGGVPILLCWPELAADWGLSK